MCENVRKIIAKPVRRSNNEITIKIINSKFFIVGESDSLDIHGLLDIA